MVKPLADNVEVVVTTCCKEGLEMLQKHFPQAIVHPFWFSVHLVIFFHILIKCNSYQRTIIQFQFLQHLLDKWKSCKLQDAPIVPLQMALTSPLIGSSRFDECVDALKAAATEIQEEFPAIHYFIHSIQTTYKALIQSISPNVSHQLSPYYHGFVNETVFLRREPASGSNFIGKLWKYSKYNFFFIIKRRDRSVFCCSFAYWF